MPKCDTSVFSNSEIAMHLFILRDRLRAKGDLSEEENAALVLATQWAENSNWPAGQGHESQTAMIKMEALRDGVKTPTKATPGSSGFDVYNPEDFTLQPGERRFVELGFRLLLPEGWEAQMRPRSGLAKNCGVTLLNSPGTIDSDYRGEVASVLINLSPEPVLFFAGDRIGQLVFCPVHKATIVEVDLIDTATDRGVGGFGSTGA